MKHKRKQSNDEFLLECIRQNDEDLRDTKMEEELEQFDLIPLVLEIISSLNESNKEKIESSLQNFEKKFEKCQNLLESLTSYNLNVTEQQNRLKQLEELLEKKE